MRDGGELRPVTWERALSEAAAALGRARGRVGAVAGGEATNEEGLVLARLMREGLGSNDVDSRTDGILPLPELRALHAPELQATVPDLEFADAVLVLDAEPVDDMPIVDLRIRKGVRRRGAKLAVATSRPSSLDPNAQLSVRFAPGAGEALLLALAAALEPGSTEHAARLAEAAGAEAGAVQALAGLLQTAGDTHAPGGAGTGDVVILYGERLVSGPRGTQAARALLSLAGALGLAGRDGAGLLGVPAGANGRGLARPASCPTPARG